MTLLIVLSLMKILPMISPTKTNLWHQHIKCQYFNCFTFIYCTLCMYLFIVYTLYLSVWIGESTLFLSRPDMRKSPKFMLKIMLALF